MSVHHLPLMYYLDLDTVCGTQPCLQSCQVVTHSIAAKHSPAAHKAFSPQSTIINRDDLKTHQKLQTSSLLLLLCNMDFGHILKHVKVNLFVFSV